MRPTRVLIVDDNRDAADMAYMHTVTAACLPSFTDVS